MTLTDYKIPIITGANGNSNPSQSGDSNHPNGSFIVAQYNALIDDLIANGISGGGGISDLSGFTTDDLSEGLNKYYSDTLARASISVTANSYLTYDNTTGIFTLDLSSFTSGVDLTAFSATGYSGFTYDNSTGVFTLDATALQGADGADGADGVSAYQIWLNQGNTGTESDFLLSLKGTDGVSLDWRGAWNSTASYLIDDAVSYNGSSYIAKTANTNKQPDTNPSDWDLWVSKGDQGEQGIQGIQGEQGIQGIQGIQGDQGIQGVAGADGVSQLYWSGTQAQYDAIGAYDNNTLYLITG